MIFTFPRPPDFDPERLANLIALRGKLVGVDYDADTVTIDAPTAAEEDRGWLEALAADHAQESLDDVKRRVKDSIAVEKRRRFDLGFPYTGTSFLTGQEVILRFSLSDNARDNYQRVLVDPDIAGPFPTAWLDQPDTDGVVLVDAAAALALANAAAQHGARLVKQAGSYTAQVLAAPTREACAGLLVAYLSDPVDG